MHQKANERKFTVIIRTGLTRLTHEPRPDRTINTPPQSSRIRAVSNYYRVFRPQQFHQRHITFRVRIYGTGPPLGPCSRLAPTTHCSFASIRPYILQVFSDTIALTRYGTASERIAYGLCTAETT
ncbi:hypothetical protein EVAR_39365_1 [Eumeta japonica]|uniref:Uncharacterized protein n=1 Tax=Eumeta variegata TaxID=151549 RepID=A0A4C1WMX8_EUMVA|nr:hypothetical protein EVAR_39365_1 [Eumeta japonica]